MNTAGLHRCVTCPVCETVLRLEVPERGADGTETYKLPAHVPWLGVNQCMIEEVTVTIGPVHKPLPLELALGVPFVDDARRRF